MDKPVKKRINRAHPKPPNVFSGVQERPISAVYPVIDTDLGRDNVENNLTAADMQDV